MTALGVLVPLSLVMGGAGLSVFLWSMRAGQYEDLKGAAERILLDDEDEGQKRPEGVHHRTASDGGCRDPR